MTSRAPGRSLVRKLARLFAAALMLACASLPAQNTPESVKVTVRWHDTKPIEGSLTNVVIFLGFHNGVFDSFDYERPLPGFVENWLGRAFRPVGDMISEFEATYSGAIGAWLWNPLDNGIAYPGPPPPPRTVTVELNPTQHRFLNYLFPLGPSNDALVGNEDPYELELFDSNGRFKGPFYVDVLGNKVVDAGRCMNDEEGLTGMDVVTVEEQLCEPGEGVVRIHPGLNGSHRNPDGVPQRVLGGETSYYDPSDESYRYFDQIDADFSRPGYKLGRLIITRQTATGRWSGSWYSPERAGEGFNVEVVEPDAGNPRPRILVYWYTFKPDGSGEQVWLSGIGEFDADGGFAADVPLHRTVGGQFASPLNPGLVEREPWGRVRIGFGSCNDGRVFYYPDDPAWPAGDYFIHRLSPEIEGLGWLCRPLGDAELVLPDD